MPFIRRLVWNPRNIAHIARHRVTVGEVEEVRHRDYIERQGYMGRTILIGPTRAGRMLAVILEYAQDDEYYVVTARPADQKERRIYREEKARG